MLLTSLTSNTIAQTTHTLSVSLSSNSIKEGDSGTKEVIVTFTTDPPRASGFNIRYCVSGTATLSSTEDYSYTFSNNIEIIFNANDNNCRNSGIPGSSFTHKIIINGDTAPEPSETVTIELNRQLVIGVPSESTPSDVIISPTAGSVTFTIEDDDPTIVSLARIGTGAVSEGDIVEFTVTLERSLIADEIIDVPLSINGTGVTTEDWNLAPKTGTGLNTGVTLSGTDTATPQVRFSGVGADTATLVLTPVIDAVTDTETFTIALGPDGDGTNGFDRTSLGTNVGGGADPSTTANSFNVTVNDTPLSEITITGGTAVTEGTAAAFTVSASPMPTSNLTVNLSVTEAAGSSFVNSTNKGMKMVIIPASSGSMTYTVATEDDNIDESNGSVTVTITNNTSYIVGSPSSAMVVVNDDDVTPRITSDATKSVAENTTDVVLTVTATDADEGTTLTYALSGGADSVRFKINQSSGALTFKTAPDFENASADGDDDYEVIVTVSDGTNSVSQTITITVTNVNDNSPMITSPATASVAENTTDVLTVMADDADAGTTLTYTITAGADSVRFRIDQNNGDLAFKTAPDFEAPGSADNDNVYEVIVTASDGTNSAMQTITVTVTDENDNDPIITSDATASIVEGTAEVLTVTATDADAGTTLTYSISGGADRALFSINRTSGVLTFITVPDFEGSSADGDDDYEITVTVSDGTNSTMQTITVTVTNDPSDDILSFSDYEEASVIFPNPSGDYLEVWSPVGGTFKILSLSGKPLLEDTTNTRVDITSLRSGLYLVQLPDGRLLKFVRE